MSFAKEAHSIYTRYADDITFSNHRPPTALFESTLPTVGRFPPDQLSSKLRSVFQQNGFAINPDKSHYADRHSRRFVTGLKVNELLNVDRRYVRNIRAALHSIETLGLQPAQKKFQDLHGGKAGLAVHLRGKISYLAHVKGLSDPVVRSLTLRFNNCFPTSPIKVTPTPEEILNRAVWVVEHSDAQGTAFFLKGVGLVTAAHCVDGVSDVEVFHPSKHANAFTATVKKRDKDRDLAILAHNIPTTEYFELDIASDTPATGDPITAAGYPAWAPGDPLNIRPGVISAITVKSGNKLIDVNQKLPQGMSGGPLFDGTNAVTGIIHKGGPTEARDFGIHIEMLKEWLLEG